MKSTTTLVAVLASATALIAAPASAQSYGQEPAQRQVASSAQQAPKPQNPNALKVHSPKVSSGAAKAITALQKAVEAKDSATIPAALEAARAVAKTPGDRYAVATLQLKAAADAKNDTAIASGLEAVLASGDVAEEEKFGLYINLAATYEGLKQKDRAEQAYRQALQHNPNSVEAMAGLAEANVADGQTKEAIALLRKGIALKAASGAKADENWYRRAVAIAYKAKDPLAVTASREWLEAYPNATSWHDALGIYEQFSNLDEDRLLELLRLRQAANVLESRDYAGFADIAIRKGLSGEAKAVLEQGFAANAIERSDPTFAELYASATQKAKGDRASLPTAPEAGSTARQTMNLGDAWYGYGDYPKAIEIYRSALAMPGADPDAINLHIGMALARSGDKAGAIAALEKVGGTKADLARYWLIYTKTKA